MNMSQLSEFIVNHWELSVAFSATLSLLLINEIRFKNRGFPDLNPQQLIQLSNTQDVILLDVRSADEREKNGTLPDDTHIPLAELKTRYGELKADTPIVTYCRSGHRSAQACNLLKGHGFTQLNNLRGGIMAWQTAKLPINNTNK